MTRGSCRPHPPRSSPSRANQTSALFGARGFGSVRASNGTSVVRARTGCAVMVCCGKATQWMWAHVGRAVAPFNRVHRRQALTLSGRSGHCSIGRRCWRRGPLRGRFCLCSGRACVETRACRRDRSTVRKGTVWTAVCASCPPGLGAGLAVARTSLPFSAKPTGATCIGAIECRTQDDL